MASAYPSFSPFTRMLLWILVGIVGLAAIGGIGTWYASREREAAAQQARMELIVQANRKAAEQQAAKKAESEEYLLGFRDWFAAYKAHISPQRACQVLYFECKRMDGGYQECSSTPSPCRQDLETIPEWKSSGCAALVPSLEAEQAKEDAERAAFYEKQSRAQKVAQDDAAKTRAAEDNTLPPRDSDGPPPEYQAAVDRSLKAAASPGRSMGDCDLFTVLLKGSAVHPTSELPRNCSRWPAGTAATFVRLFEKNNWPPKVQLCMIYRIEDRYLPGGGETTLSEPVEFCTSARNPWK